MSSPVVILPVSSETPEEPPNPQPEPPAQVDPLLGIIERLTRMEEQLQLNQALTETALEEQAVSQQQTQAAQQTAEAAQQAAQAAQEQAQAQAQAAQAAQSEQETPAVERIPDPVPPQAEPKKRKLGGWF